MIKHLKKLFNWYLKDCAINRYLAWSLWDTSYFGFVISVILITQIIYPNNYTYAIVLLLHLASIWSFRKKYYYQDKSNVPRILLNVVLIIFSCIAGKISTTIFICAFLLLITFIYARLSDFFTSCGFINPILQKIETPFFVICFCIPILSILIPLFFLPWNLFFKVSIILCIVLAYLFFTPYISCRIYDYNWGTDEVELMD